MVKTEVLGTKLENSIFQNIFLISQYLLQTLLRIDNHLIFVVIRIFRSLCTWYFSIVNIVASQQFRVYSKYVNYFSTVYFHFACSILVEFLVPENIHTPLPRRTIVLQTRHHSEISIPEGVCQIHRPPPTPHPRPRLLLEFPTRFDTPGKTISVVNLLHCTTMRKMIVPEIKREKNPFIHVNTVLNQKYVYRRTSRSSRVGAHKGWEDRREMK